MKIKFLHTILNVVLVLSAFSQSGNIIEKFHSNPDSVFLYFANPVLRDKTDIQKWFDDVKILLEELNKPEYDNNPKAVEIFGMLDVYNHILKAPGKWETVDNIFSVKSKYSLSEKILTNLIQIMKKSYYEVMNEFRKIKGLKMPRGYIFVWLFSSREEFTLTLDLSKEVGGLTYLCRFIFIPIEYYNLYDFPVADFENFEQTFSHELAHSIFNSTIGIKRASKLPKWFKEGVAIYFGGNRKISFRGNTKRELSIMYKNYYDLFNYMVKDFGKEKIAELIAKTIEGKNPETVFSKFSGYESTETYLKHKKTIFYIKFFLSIVALIILTVVIYKLLLKFDVEINLPLYIFWILLIVIGFVVFSSVFVISIKSKIPLIINGSLLFFIVINDIIFNIKYLKYKKMLKILENTAGIEKYLFEVVDFYEYKTKRKKRRILELIKETIEKLICKYEHIENAERMNDFSEEFEHKIFESYDLRTSDDIVNLLEKFKFKIEEINKEKFKDED